MNNRIWVSRLAVIVLCLPLQVHSQANATASNCPLTIKKFTPSGINIHVQNVTGKTIVGLSFYVALADATEHWKWYHWDFDDTRPLQEFAWNKTIKPGVTKSLSWGTNLNFERGGGGAFVLTSVLFEDGSRWEEPADRASCKALWYNSHKKGFVKPIELPLRPQ
jgi:hypothetical protein